MSELALEVAQREVFGTNAARRLRREGQVPVILYGEGKESLSLTVEARALERLLQSGAGENALFELSLSGTDMRRTVMIKQVQRHPTRGDIEHCDFIRISMDKLVEVRVPVQLSGVADGVKNEAGICESVLRDVGVRCLPNMIPEVFELDISPLCVGDALRVSDVALPEGVEVLDAPNHIVAHVVPSKVEKEVAVAEEEAAPLEEGAEEAEGATTGTEEEDQKDPKAAKESSE